MTSRTTWITHRILQGKSWLVTCLLLCLLLVPGCSKKAQLGGDFKIMVLSDTHISSSQDKPARLRHLVGRVNAGEFPGVELVFITGDVVSNVYGDYTPENPDTSDNRLRRAMSILRELNVPFYPAMGNHDHKIASFRDSDAPWPQEEIHDMWRLWRQQTGFEPYYTISHKGWQFIVMNSMAGRHLERHFDDEHLNWLRAELKDGLPTLLFFHHPLRTDNFRLWCKPGQWTTREQEPKFYAILEDHQDSIKGIFVGHGHMFVQDSLFNKIGVYETDSFGEGADTSYHIVALHQADHSLAVMQGAEYEQMQQKR